MPLGFLNLSPVLLTVLVGALIVVANVWLVLLFVRKRRAVTEAVCGKCGYAVVGLPTFTCPECGSDLREVGIVRGRGRGPRARRTQAPSALNLLAWLAAWTVVYGALYAFLGARSYPARPAELKARPFEYGLVDAYLWPYEGRSTHAVALVPRSDGYRRVTVTEVRHARFRGWRNAPRADWTGDSPVVGLVEHEITLQLDTEDGKSSTLTIDPRTLGWNYVNPNPDPADPKTNAYSGAGPVDGAALWGWMYNSGVTIPSQLVKDEADALADMVKRTTTAGFVGGPVWATGRLERIAAAQRDATPGGSREYVFREVRGTAQDSYGPAWSIYWLSIPFGLGLYSYGTSWIFTRHKRRLTALAPGGGSVAARGGGDEEDSAEFAESAGAVSGGPGRGAAVAAAPSAAAAVPAVAPSAGRAAAAPSRGGAAPARLSRTLTVLFTDLKDYTARTASASRRNLLALLRLNKSLVEEAVGRHGGTVVKTIGDAYLVTFESATDAVLAGLAIQGAAAAHNAAAPPAERIEYRIACATGEVTPADNDVFGTPVNVAARVQALATPGDVCFAESTFHSVNAAEVPSEDLGPHELKGISAPVRIYRAVRA